MQRWEQTEGRGAPRAVGVLAGEVQLAGIRGRGTGGWSLLMPRAPRCCTGRDRGNADAAGFVIIDLLWAFILSENARL